MIDVSREWNVHFCQVQLKMATLSPHIGRRITSGSLLHNEIKLHNHMLLFSLDGG